MTNKFVPVRRFIKKAWLCPEGPFKTKNVGGVRTGRSTIHEFTRKVNRAVFTSLKRGRRLVLVYYLNCPRLSPGFKHDKKYKEKKERLSRR